MNNNFSLTSAACITCHLTDYNGTTNPPHKSSGFPQDCSGCHNTTQWTGATFNHTATGFALTGAHTSLQCAQCHVNNNFTLASGACCQLPSERLQRHHQPAAHNPRASRRTAPFATALPQWTGATFNHTTTGFALTGAHTSVQCAQCHVNNNFSLTSGACAGTAI